MVSAARRRCSGGRKFVGTVTEKLLTYALGRGVDLPRHAGGAPIVRDAARSDYRFSSIVLGIVKSTPFQMRASAGAGRAGLARNGATVAIA